MTINLDFLPQTTFVLLLIFARVGTMIMVMPGFGDNAVPARLRLVFALGVTLVLYPVARDFFTAVPATISALLAMVIMEVLVGLAIGIGARLIMSALHLAGTAIAFQTGLAFAQNIDPSQGGAQSSLFGNFLGLLAVTLVFMTDLHHLLLAAIHDSYTLFRPGILFPVGDFSELALSTIATAFTIALQLAAPFLVFGLVFYLGIGVLSRLIPQVQVFFVAMPANILLGFLLLMLLLSTIMLWFLESFRAAIEPLLAG